MCARGLRVLCLGILQNQVKQGWQTEFKALAEQQSSPGIQSVVLTFLIVDCKDISDSQQKQGVRRNQHHA